MRDRGFISHAIRIIGICLFISSIFSIKAFAYNNNTVFNDVAPNNYYYTSVHKLKEAEIISGYPDGNFYPYNNITHAEIIKILSKVLNIDTTNYDNSTWYSAPLSWMIDNGIVDKNIDNQRFATREDLCTYIGTIYQIKIDRNIENIFSDTKSYLLLNLSNLGIINGIETGDKLEFRGDQLISRADTCVIVDRVIEKLGRQLPNKIEKDSNYYRYGVHKSQYKDTIYNSSKLNKYSLDSLENVWLYMISNGVRAYKIPCNININDRDTLINDIKKARDILEIKLPEYCYYDLQYNIATNTKTYQTTGETFITEIIITRNFKDSTEESFNEAIQQINEFDNKSYELVLSLYEDNKLNNKMGTKDKLETLYNYITTDYEYDYSYNNHTGYEMINTKKAVCSGFVAMFSRLSHILGIPVEGYVGTDYIRNNSHILNRYKNNNTWYYIDTTFGVSKDKKIGNPEWFWFNQEKVNSYMIPQL